MDNKMTEYVLRHSKKNDKELKYDFMPAMLEMIERPAHIAGTVIIVGIFTLLCAAVLWACLSKVDVVVTSPGSVQPVGNVNMVKSYTAGTVKAVNISEGQYVREGEVMIELDTGSIDIDVDRLTRQKEILAAQIATYNKLKKDIDISNLALGSYRAEVRSYIQVIRDSDRIYHNSLADLENERKTADLNHQIAQNQLEQYRRTNQSMVKSQELVVQQAEVALETAERRITETKTQYSAQINAKFSELSDTLNGVESEIRKYELSKEYQNITAPVAGYVNYIAVNTPGETVTSAQDLVTIVPESAPLEMVCYVKNMDIADITEGMAAAVKLEAYPYNKFGTVSGTVKYISPSSFSSETQGSVYLVKLELDDSNDRIRLMSGLSGSVEIKTGKRSVMDYFLDPIMKGFGESLREK